MPEFSIRILTKEQKRIIKRRNDKSISNVKPKSIKRTANRMTGKVPTQKELAEAVAVELTPLEQKLMTPEERALAFFEEMHKTDEAQHVVYHREKIY